ncbi:MAG: hypothetical protein IT305_12140 [Chloroflexi bacterium]|nr:hypothetical protein [Chloroflexota bacterium]
MNRNSEGQPDRARKLAEDLQRIVLKNADQINRAEGPIRFDAHPKGTGFEIKVNLSLK